MEFKGEILSHLLRIITRRVIARLSTSSHGKKKVSLSVIVDNYQTGGKSDKVESKII